MSKPAPKRRMRVESVARPSEDSDSESNAEDHLWHEELGVSKEFMIAMDLMGSDEDRYRCCVSTRRSLNEVDEFVRNSIITPLWNIRSTRTSITVTRIRDPSDVRVCVLRKKSK
jgi:hypothetical protein